MATKSIPTTPEPTDVHNDVLDLLNDEFPDNAEIKGKIYRVNSELGSPGRPLKEYAGTVNQIVDEEYIGKNFGPGNYEVRYTAFDGRTRTNRSISLHIGQEFAKYAKQPLQAPQTQNQTDIKGGLIDGIIGQLTPDKITAFAMAIKAVKELFAPPPPPPPVDLAALITALNSSRPAPQQMSDAIIVKALDGMQQQQKQTSLLQQLKEFEQVRAMLKENKDDDDDDDKENGDTMNMIIKTALAYLPQLLQKNGNNFQAAGAEASQNALVQNMVANDPELAKKFFETAVNTYGIENARALANGFGYQLGEMQQEQQEQQQAAPEMAAMGV